MPAQKLWYAILEAQIETDGPFMTYKDHTNRKSNQKNPEETAVCNVASLALPSFVVNGEYDFKKLHDKELENVGMPWFEVDGKGSRTFVALIDVASYARNIGTMPFE